MSILISNENELTPVDKIDDFLFVKRDDLFSPSDASGINGGKLRQCIFLFKSIEHKYNGVITGCGIYSPQSSIVSYVANKQEIPSYVCVGGTTENNINQNKYLSLSKKYGGQIINLKSGRHTVLYKYARERALKDNLFLVNYGINLDDNMQSLIFSTANQVENIPDYLDNLFITCGSGITSIGILVGIKKFGKKIRNITLIGNAPNRTLKIKKTLALIENYDNQYKGVLDIDFNFIDRYSDINFKYERKETGFLNDILLHPNYEAKAWNYIVQEKLLSGKNLFWIVGASL
jgi:1-aminocyclopropane-1-carboxylate deaminase/D-cysteine desulfhydrase-like pyridoxal-dependent ACC family enzyme